MIRIEVKLAVLSAMGMFLMASCSSSEDLAAEDASFLQRNGKNPEVLDDRFGDKAEVACSGGSDDYLRTIAAHEFKWSSEAEGFTGSKFDKISTRSAGNGLLTLVSDRALFSNVFGAFDPVTFYCLYDVKTKKVVRYSTSDPSLEAEGDTGQ